MENNLIIVILDENSKDNNTSTAIVSRPPNPSDIDWKAYFRQFRLISMSKPCSIQWFKDLMYKVNALWLGLFFISLFLISPINSNNSNSTFDWVIVFAFGFYQTAFMVYNLPTEAVRVNKSWLYTNIGFAAFVFCNNIVFVIGNYYSDI